MPISRRKRRGPAIETPSVFPTEGVAAMFTSREVADRYLAVNPHATDSIKRAILAYHSDRWTLGGHLFQGPYLVGEPGGGSQSICAWCGRSREQVRWDDLPPTCASRPKDADMYVGVVIRREDQLFERVLERAQRLARSVDILALTGEELATIHHTHGIDPSMLEIALMDAGRGSLPQSLHDAYQLAYDTHRQTGKQGGVKREVVVAKTAVVEFAIPSIPCSDEFLQEWDQTIRTLPPEIQARAEKWPYRPPGWPKETAS